MLVLVVDSMGPAVKFIQKTLHTVPVDGEFDPITKNCVMEYQRAKNIEVDGIVGIHTWTAIVAT